MPSRPTCCRRSIAGSVVPFSPYGYDERQLCSPGFDLPIGRLTRSVNGGYPQYHTFGGRPRTDTPASVSSKVSAACKLFVTVLEDNGRYVNRKPKGEPRLGKRGLYGAVGGASPGEREHAMLWVLNQSDGSQFHCWTSPVGPDYASTSFRKPRSRSSRQLLRTRQTGASRTALDLARWTRKRKSAPRAASAKANCSTAKEQAMKVVLFCGGLGHAIARALR